VKKSLTLLAVGLAVLCSATGVQARDTKLLLPIKEALNYVGKKGSAKEILDPSIALVFGHGDGGDNILQADMVSNRKTNGFGKSDVDACHWAFLSAVKQFQQSAKDVGGTKVVNLVSYYKKREFKSTTEYECHAGAFIVGVTLKGDIAR
jgi:lipoprotein